MGLEKELILLAAIAVVQSAGLIPNLSHLAHLKRAVAAYNYPTPGLRFNAPLPPLSFSPPAGRTVVETVKSISPAQYLPPTGYSNRANANSNIQGLAPPQSVSYNAYEPPRTPQRTVTVTAAPVTAVRPGKRPGNLASYRYYNQGGSSPSGASAPAAPSAPVAPVATSQPAPVRTSSVEPATARPAGGYQYNKPSGGGTRVPTATATATANTGPSAPAAAATTKAPAPTAAAPGTTASAATTKEAPTAAAKPAATTKTQKGAGYAYPSPKNGRKPTKTSQKIADSKPEETGLTGYHYNAPLGGAGRGVLASGGGGAMMGASYMRSSSPFYNYHVMLD